jgi:ribosomal protein L32
MNDCNSTTNRERIRMHLVQALTRAESDTVRQHLQAALEEWEHQPPTSLQECSVCGKMGLPERIQHHSCGIKKQNDGNI